MPVNIDTEKCGKIKDCPGEGLCIHHNKRDKINLINIRSKSWQEQMSKLASNGF